MRWLFQIVLFLGVAIFLSSLNTKSFINDVKRIEKLNLLIKPNSLIIPGNTFEIGLSALTGEGDKLLTKGWLGGKLKWKYFEISVTNGEFSNGKIILDESFDPQKDSIITITVKLKNNRNIIAEEELKVNHLVGLELFTGKFNKRAPGSSFPIDVIATYDNGITINSYNFIHCPDKFRNLNIKVSGGKYRKNLVHIHEDPNQIQNHRITAIVSSGLYPHIIDTLSLKLNYIKDYQFSSSGGSGFNGFNGSSGSDGFMGDNGGCGIRGEDGRDGESRYPVRVYVDSYYDSILFHPVLKVQVRDFRTVKNYLINPNGGTLNITSVGGNGGHGGNGGNGGNGGRGQDGWKKVEKEKINDSTYVEKEIIGPGFDGGSGGHGGSGGSGGDGGNGGDIIVKYTKAAEPFLYLFELNSMGGYGGRGGYGGLGGTGGTGGNGNPDGRDGCSGKSGWSGLNGFDGRGGEIIFEETSNISQTLKE